MTSLHSPPLVPWEDRREPGAPSSPGQALAERDGRRDHALQNAVFLVEETITLRFVQRDVRQFRVGHASRPLGGKEGWIDTDVVPSVIEIYTERGWKVYDEGRCLVFELPEDMPL